MEDKEIEVIAKGVNPKCVGCVYLGLNEGETRIFCNKKDEAITENHVTCTEKKEHNIVQTISKPLENKRHESFIQYYLVSLNAADAARRAGYSVKTAKTIGSKLLTNVDLQDRVQALVAERNQKIGIDAEKIVQDLMQIKDRCMQSVPVMVWNAALKRYVEKTVIVEDEDGNKTAKTVYQFDAHSAIKSLDLLGKHVGLYEKDNRQKDNNITIFQLPDNGRTKPEE